MTDYAWHKITVREGTPRAVKFRVDVYRGGELVDVDPDTGECEFIGGVRVATVYAPTLGMAHHVGIAYSFRCKG